MKKAVAGLLVLCLLTGSVLADGDTEIGIAVDTGAGEEECFAVGEIAVSASGIEIPAPEAILMEKETGQVLYEKNADTPRQPASVTKVMTILLIAEAIDSGTIRLDDVVTVSENARKMGGSQVYLEEGEQMTVDDLLKCIVVSSANDAAVAMAEYLAGTESAFAEKMNGRAKELGAENTHFTNCTGLENDPSHVTTARDLALISREVLRHGWLRDYTTIWTDTIRDGAFGLSNTNKLIRYYEGATGLKTGYTGSAGYCLAATAERENVEYVAVVMGSETSQDRFRSASDLLNYGFANYTLTELALPGWEPSVPVRLGKMHTAELETEALGAKLLVRKQEASGIEVSWEQEEELEAPIEPGQVVGTVTVTAENGVLAEYPITVKERIGRVRWGETFLRVLSGIIGREQIRKTVD